MKYFWKLLTLFFFFTLPFAQAQEESTTPLVNWEYTASKNADGTFNLQFVGKIATDWKLFSYTMSDDDPNMRMALDSLSASRSQIQFVKETGNLLTATEPLLDNLEIRYFEKEVTVSFTLSYTDEVKNASGILTYFLIKGEEVLPEELEFRFNAAPDGNLVAVAGGLQASEGNRLKRDRIDMNNPVIKIGGILEEDSGILMVFFLGFLGGLIALVTPCVFPMIPLTVSFFIKSSQNKKQGIFNAATYGFFILLIYLLCSVPFHLMETNSEIFNNLSTNVWMNMIFFAVFVIFALSFFGLYDITLPSSFASKADSKANKGTILGIFFMALTLVIVSFSCTGPILGSLLAGSLNADGGAWLLTAGMAGFGLSLALPFALFAMFPSWLNTLPKSGGWLTSVKVVLGFVELALAVKFLSNADLVSHWGILHRETFFLIWIIIAVLTTLYLLGFIRFPHDSPIQKLGKVRIFFAVLFGALALYLIPGLTNTKYARLQLMSGFAPPMSYSWYGNTAHEKGAVEPDIMNDYEAALVMAKEANKPILIDFTGWACVNCRNMEENVWTVPEIHDLIKDNFILVSLYVDDKAKLPEGEEFMHVFADGRKKPIRTIGNKYATMQSENFINSSQPLYVVISPDEQLLTLPVGYTPDVEEYAKWLRAGIEAFKQVSNK
jgi:thiol:disulfide interchange protein